MTNLSQITIEVWETSEDDGPYFDPEHINITLAANAVSDLMDAKDEDWPGDDAAWDAMRYSAGLLARLGLWASQWMPEEQIEHACHPTYWRSTDLGKAPELLRYCHVSASRAVLAVRDGNWEVGPMVDIYVAKARKAEWLDRIEEWFGVIATAEDGPPLAVTDPTDIQAYARTRPA